MAVSDDGGGGVALWYETFPFVDDFSGLLSGAVSFVYLDELVRVLVPTVDVLTEMVKTGPARSEAVLSLIFSVAALARVRVAQAYEVELSALDLYDRDQVAAALSVEWSAMVQRDEMVFVGYSPSVASMLEDVVRDVWVVSSLSNMSSGLELQREFSPVFSDVRVVVIGELLVQSPRGKPFSVLDERDKGKCMVSVDIYRVLLNLLKGRFSEGTLIQPSDLEAVVVEEASCGIDVVPAARVLDWLWLVVSSRGQAIGYCYQLMLPPLQRFTTCKILGLAPTVQEFLHSVVDVHQSWSSMLASIQIDEVLHVVHSGNPDIEALSQYSERRIGMPVTPVDSQPDYFAKALVDDFISRHTPVQYVSQVQPVDSEFGSLSLDLETVGSRGFIEVATGLYGGIGEGVSPRTEYNDRPNGGMVSMDEHTTERDSQRVKEVYSRLADGAFIEEDYYYRSRHRLMRLRSRPRLHSTTGRSYHVFAGFPADGGGGLGPWVIDKDWDIPGWQSYVASFDPRADTTVSFISPVGCTDIRMDCSGDAAIEFGDCRVATWSTVIWFSNSIKFRLVTKSNLTLRISIPDAGSAKAMSTDLRRYLYIPGYAVVARSFDVVTGVPTVIVAMARARQSLVAGCHLYSGNKYVERGRHRFKLTQLPSAAPIRMILKTDPIEALDYLTVCGMRLKPRTRDYVSVLFDVSNADLYVTLNSDAELQVSVAQIVRHAEFDLTVASIRKT